MRDEHLIAVRACVAELDQRQVWDGAIERRASAPFAVEIDGVPPVVSIGNTDDTREP